LRRERRTVTNREAVGPYTLLRVDRGGLDPGAPGQFFMLEAPGRLLPRPMSLCLALPGELAFLIDPIGPGTQALCSLESGDSLHVFGPLGHGFHLDVERPLLVGGGIGIAPLPYLSAKLDRPPAILGFRTESSFVTATINADGTFATRLHAGQHVADLGGMPVGYELRSVRAGNTDVAKGLAITDADVSNVVITVRAPAQLPRLRGRVSGAPANAKVQITGPIVGSQTASIGTDGTFDFPALVPGLYYARVPEAPALGTTLVVVTQGGVNEAVIGAPPARQ